MAQVFISHSRHDSQYAKVLAEWIESSGWTVWWDTQLLGGDAFRGAIERELRQANCVVVLWSAKSAKSHWVVDEAQLAAEKGLLLPILLPSGEIPLGFRQFQTLSMPKTWSPSNPELVVLGRSISSFVGAPSTIKTDNAGSSTGSGSKQGDVHTKAKFTESTSHSPSRAHPILSPLILALYVIVGGGLGYWLCIQIFEQNSLLVKIGTFIAMMIGFVAGSDRTIRGRK